MWLRNDRNVHSVDGVRVAGVCIRRNVWQEGSIGNHGDS